MYFAIFNGTVSCMNEVIGIKLCRVSAPMWLSIPKYILLFVENIGLPVRYYILLKFGENLFPAIIPSKLGPHLHIVPNIK